MIDTTFSILICTRNRIADLSVTLSHIKTLLSPGCSCVVYDDGSTDGTAEFVRHNYPQIRLLRNEESKGLLYCRNMMLNQTVADYAISLDDDSHFVTENPLPIIQSFFEDNSRCGVIAFRIFWGIEFPEVISNNDVSCQVQGYVGCGHVWRLAAWKQIPNYPEWFEFYGEEDFASWNLLKIGWHVHFLPHILVHHRVDVKERKSQKDYTIRLRRSLRAGWYLILLFYPTKLLPRLLLYSLWVQIKKRFLKGDLKGTIAIMGAGLDLIKNSIKLYRSRNPFSNAHFYFFRSLPATKIYWNPAKENDHRDTGGFI